MIFKEFYTGYAPPLNYLRHLRSVVERLDPNLIQGLGLTLLRNSASIGRREARKKLASGGSLCNVQGVYFRAWDGQEARIELFVDSILDEWPDWILRVPIFRYEIVSIVFFHELAHHLQARKNPMVSGEEAAARELGRELARDYFARRYRLLLPILRPLKKLANKRSQPAPTSTRPGK